LLGCVLTTSSQKIEDGWQGLRALDSSKADVEKLLGPPKRVDDNGYYYYEKGDAFAEVNYSTEPCQPNHYNRGKYNLPVWTVLQLRIRPDKPLLRADVKFDPNDFVIDRSGDVFDLYDYISESLGIRMSFAHRRDLNGEYLQRIEYWGEADRLTKLKCEVGS
jgi:hypothetical protein